MKDSELKITCTTKDVPVTQTRKAFLREFLKTVPETYFLSDTIQCAKGKNRSFSDLLYLTKDRFPRTTLNAIVRIVAQLNIEGICDVVWCTQVKKFVVRGGKNNPGMPFVSSYSVKYFKETVGSDKISYQQLIKIREEENIK